MKPMLYLFISLVSLILLASCSNDSYFGYEPEEKTIFVEENDEIVSISSYHGFTVINVNGEKTFVNVDSVSGAEQNIALPDTVEQLFLNVELEKAQQFKIEPLTKELICKTENYAVYKQIFRVHLRYRGMLFPVEFSRDIVSYLDKNGREYPQNSTGRAYVKNAEYTGIEFFDDHSHSKTFFDVTMVVFDNEENLGSLTAHLSFYTANAAISFGAGVADVENGDVTETNL